MSTVDNTTDLLILEARDRRISDILFGEKGTLEAWLEFLALYAIDPKDITEGFNFTGTPSSAGKVQYEEGDIAGYLEAKLKEGNGIVFTINGTTTKDITMSISIDESTSTGTSLLVDNSTLKKLVAGTNTSFSGDATEVIINTAISNIFSSLVVTDTTYNSIETAGGLRSNGGNWDDVNLDVSNLTGNGIDPSSRSFAGNLSIASFRSNGTDEVETSIELPHRRKEGSIISLHGHAFPESATTGYALFRAEYIFNYAGMPRGTTTIVDLTVVLDGTTNRQDFTFPDIIVPTDLVGEDFAAQFRFKVSRIGSSDTYGDWIGVSTIGIHIDSDGLGSDGIVSKT